MSDKKSLLHSFLIVIALGLAFLAAQTSISEYSLQISGFLVAVYILISFLTRRKFLTFTSRVQFDIFIFSFAVSFLLFTTGGFTSPVFFLAYFLLFGISLLSGPATSIIAALVFAILFVITPRTDFWAEILQVVSLISIAPISMMFGKQYIEILNNEQKIKVLKNVGRDFVEEIKFQEKEVKNWTEGDFRLKLVSMQKYLTELINDPDLSKKKKEKLNALHHQIYELFQSGMEMKKEIGK